MIAISELEKKITKKQAFELIDIYFAKFISKNATKNNLEVLLACAVLSKLSRGGHTCITFDELNNNLINLNEITPINEPFLPNKINWKETLINSGVAGREGEFYPIIISEKNLLYLYRYWHYENLVFKLINKMTAAAKIINCKTLLNEGLTRLFGEKTLENSETNWQKIAATVALLNQFTVITGGPGTGKTSTVAKIIALILFLYPDKKIAIAAPTGKAAGRMGESIKIEKNKMNIDDKIKDLFPSLATTIHRLLGSSFGSCKFRHNNENPLKFDAVIIDEASMIDLPLMAKLIDALKPDCNIILIGDKNQLSSVETGYVFGDICNYYNVDNFSRDYADKIGLIAGENLSHFKYNDSGWIKNSIVELKKNYRFGDLSAISNIGLKINSGAEYEVINILKNPTTGEISWQILPNENNLIEKLRGKTLDFFKKFLKAADIGSAFAIFNSFRILCAVNIGYYGTEKINLLVEEILAGANLIKPQTIYYTGRPIMITKNDYNLNLYNGDIGLIFTDESGETKAYFEDINHDEAGNKIFKSLSPGRLPEHETVFAMTIHKSQGSEFDDLLIILPPEESPVLTRELLYTAITRTRKTAEIWANEDIIKKTVSGKIKRTSGLPYN